MQFPTSAFSIAVASNRHVRLTLLCNSLFCLQFCCCFNDADNVFITPVYAAGEDVSTEVDSKVLVEGIRRHGHQHVDLIDRSNLAKTIFKICKPDDLIVFLGAGDITQWAHELKEELEKIKP